MCLLIFFNSKPPQPVEDEASSPRQDAVAKEATGVMDQFLDDCLASSEQVIWCLLISKGWTLPLWSLPNFRVLMFL